MRFPYTYKTSDGVRHQSECEASSKDEVFAALRKQGIRPIKVFDPIVDPSSRWLKICVWILISVACALTTTFFFFREERKGAGSQSARYCAETYPVFTGLVARAQNLIDRKNRYFSELDLDRARNYALIEEMPDVEKIKTELKKARLNINYTRAYVRDVFRDIYKIFPEASVNEIEDSKALYARLMDELDADETRIMRDSKALDFLAGHRGKWRAHGKEIVFSDSKLELEFSCFRPESGERVSRWSKDFLVGEEKGRSMQQEGNRTVESGSK